MPRNAHIGQAMGPILAANAPSNASSRIVSQLGMTYNSAARRCKNKSSFTN